MSKQIEEAKNHLKSYIKMDERLLDVVPKGSVSHIATTKCLGYWDVAIKALEFAEFVAEEIFDENWEYNNDVFAEIACRKLADMGIVKADWDKWYLMESEESDG